MLKGCLWEIGGFNTALKLIFKRCSVKQNQVVTKYYVRGMAPSLRLIFSVPYFAEIHLYSTYLHSSLRVCLSSSLTIVSTQTSTQLLQNPFLCFLSENYLYLLLAYVKYSICCLNQDLCYFAMTLFYYKGVQSFESTYHTVLTLFATD